MVIDKFIGKISNYKYLLGRFLKMLYWVGF
jgi:hypothetical protein